MHECFTLDLGPGFVGGSAKVGEKRVCVLAPSVTEDATLQGVARELVRRQGADCGECRLPCPLKRAE